MNWWPVVKQMYAKEPIKKAAAYSTAAFYALWHVYGTDTVAAAFTVLGIVGVSIQLLPVRLCPLPAT